MKSSALIRQLSFFWKNYRKQVLVGSSAILAIDVADLFLPLLIRNAIDSFSSGKPSTEAIRSLIWGLAVVVCMQVFGRYIWRVALSKGAMLAGATFRKGFSKKSFEIVIPEMEKKKVGDLMTLATSDIENMRFALGPGIIGLIDSAFYLVTVPIAMYWIAPDLTWKVLLPVMVIPVVVWLLQGKIAVQSKKVQSQIGKLGTMTQEMISGVRIIKTYGLEARIIEKLSAESHALNDQQVEMTRTQSKLGPGMEFFLSTSVVLLFSSEGYSIGTLVAMQRYLQKLLWPLTACAMSVIYFQKAKSSGTDFYSFLDDEKVEKPSENRSVILEPDGSVPLIEARNLSFSYEAGKPVIKNLNFRVLQGEWVGISGAVGTGKSTLLQLLLKFYPVERGQLFVNGVDVNDYAPADLRRFFSSVMQDPYLFQGTLLENLHESDENHPLSWSMKISGMHEEEFSHRLNDKLGEKGAGLSGGQKQRVGIARAVRKRAPALLLDDPLSSVDWKTADHVLSQLSTELKKIKKTVLLVSHHEEHLQYCDRVVRI